MPDPELVPQTEEEKRLAQQLVLENYRKAIAAGQEATALSNQKILQAGRDSWKAPEVKALDGKITASGTFIESRILAAQTLNSAFGDLIKAISAGPVFKDKNLTFILHNSTDLPAIELYLGMLDHLTSIDDYYKIILQSASDILNKELPEKKLGGGGGDPLLLGYAASGIIRTIVDTVSLFKTNTSFTNFDITTDETTVVASFHQAIQKFNLNWKIFYPAVFPVNTIKNSNPQPGEFITVLNAIRNKDAAGAVKIIEIEKKATELQELLPLTKEPGKSEISKQLVALETAKLTIQQLGTAFSQLQTVLGITDPASQITLRSTIIRAERIFGKLTENDVFVIKFSVNSYGSDRISDSLFRSAKIAHSGGTQLSCLIFEADGNIIFSSHDYSYKPYKNADEIR